MKIKIVSVSAEEQQRIDDEADKIFGTIPFDDEDAKELNDALGKMNKNLILIVKDDDFHTKERAGSKVLEVYNELKSKSDNIPDIGDIYIDIQEHNYGTLSKGLFKALNEWICEAEDNVQEKVVEMIIENDMGAYWQLQMEVSYDFIQETLDNSNLPWVYNQ